MKSVRVKLKTLLKPSLVRNLTTSESKPGRVNPDQLVRVCTILYQQQNSAESRLNSALAESGFELSHELFLRVCNEFPRSWRPVYRFFGYTLTRPEFAHTSVSLNKVADSLGKSRNINLFWDFVHEIGRRKLANDVTFRIALRTLAGSRELNKCVEFFHVMNGYGVGYSLERLNMVVESLCGVKLVDEAKFLVGKLREVIEPDGFTYGCLVKGFCDIGDVVEASKVWNLMVEKGFDPGIGVVEAMMVVFFKKNRYDEALKVFQMMRVKRIGDLRSLSYGVVIEWMCKRGMVSQAYVVFDEMRERGIGVDNAMMGSLVYGLVSRGRVNEGYKVVARIEAPDISVYHGLIKGLLRLRRAGEATEVFREMIRRGCEPIMHTYVMLLQGHLGKRGRRGLDPLVNFNTIFVGGLVKAGKLLEATKFVERSMKRGVEVPRFDYNKFLHYYSNEDGVVMFEEVGKKLREVGLFDLADIFQRYGEKMATRDRRRER